LCNRPRTAHASARRHADIFAGRFCARIALAIAGDAGASIAEAFRWVNGVGMTGLGDLPGGRDYSIAYAVSADGNVVVGESNSTNSGGSFNEAFRWTAATGMVSLGLMPNGTANSRALAASGDGSIIVGTGGGIFSNVAFIWDAAHGSRRFLSMSMAWAALV
jgi:probable HAF family extracellular repeat protein